MVGERRSWEESLTHCSTCVTFEDLPDRTLEADLPGFPNNPSTCDKVALSFGLHFDNLTLK